MSQTRAMQVGPVPIDRETQIWANTLVVGMLELQLAIHWVWLDIRRALLRWL